VVTVVLAASFIYAKVLNQADDEFDSADVKDRLAASTTTGTGEEAMSVEGTWRISAGSEVGYRVDETINGFDTTANGRTQSITGSIVIAGTTVPSAEFTVDMATFTSDESRRDNQFKGRIMDVATFPTATFVLTEPIDFAAVPPDGGSVSVSGTGNLTLHGTTKSVTFDLDATFENGRVGVLGKIPVLFADYGIPNPSFATITTADNGVLEFVLILEHA